MNGSDVNAPNFKISQDQGNLISGMMLNDHKAGMQELDKEKINKIIYEASKGSKFYENELRKDKVVAQRILELQEQLNKLKPDDVLKAEKLADAHIARLQSSLVLARKMVHIDMDAFYAAVEMRDDPSLRTVPMAVGGESMLSTSNYLARRFGVRAAMPGFIARKLCPELVIVPGSFSKYRTVSRQVQEILVLYDANFSMMSLDEAHLDFTDHVLARRSSAPSVRTFPEAAGAEPPCCCDDLGRVFKHSWKENVGDDTDDLNSGKVANESTDHRSRGILNESFDDFPSRSERNQSFDDFDSGSESFDDFHSGSESFDDFHSGSERFDDFHSGSVSDAGNMNGAQRSFRNDDLQDIERSEELQNQIQRSEELQNQIQRSEELQNQIQRSEELQNQIQRSEELQNQIGGCNVQRAVPEHPENPRCTSCGLSKWPVGSRVFGISFDDAVAEMRYRIWMRTGLTASAGLACNKLIAKISSDLNKPNGQHRVESSVGAVQAFMEQLPIRKVPGIGKVSEQLLRSLGVVRCRDLREERGKLLLLKSRSAFEYLMQVACGVGSTETACRERQKSVSVERTFLTVSRHGQMEETIRQLSGKLSADLREQQALGRTVTLKLKLDNFKVMTRSSSVKRFTCDEAVIFAAARDLLRREISRCSNLRVRLLGVRMSNLHEEKAGQISINEMFRRQSDGSCASTCPVCQCVKQFASDGQFERHVNWCLLRSSATEAGQGDPTVGHSHQPRLEEGHSHQSRLEEGRKESSGAVNMMAEQRVKLKDGVGSSVGCSRPSGEMAECPICRQKVALEDANRHVDSCLSRQEIKSILLPKPVSVNKKRKSSVDGKKPQKRINQYFQ